MSFHARRATIVVHLHLHAFPRRSVLHFVHAPTINKFSSTSIDDNITSFGNGEPLFIEFRKLILRLCYLIFRNASNHTGRHHRVPEEQRERAVRQCAHPQHQQAASHLQGETRQAIM